jgi:hypothetical protein
VLEVIERRANLQTTGIIYNKEIQLLAYADDIDIVGNDTTIRDVGQCVAIGNKHFEVVKEFVYLGSLMTPANDVSLEVQRTILDPPSLALRQ